MTTKPTFWQHLTFVDGAPIPVTSIRAGTSWDLGNLDSGLIDFVQQTNRCSICGHRLGDIVYQFVADKWVGFHGHSIGEDYTLMSAQENASGSVEMSEKVHLECILESLRHSPYTAFNLEENPAHLIMGLNGGRHGDTAGNRNAPQYAWPVPLRKPLTKQTPPEALHQYDTPVPALAPFAETFPDWFDKNDPIPEILSAAESYGEFHTEMLSHAELEAHTPSPQRYGLVELEIRLGLPMLEERGQRTGRGRRYQAYAIAVRRSYRKTGS